MQLKRYYVYQDTRRHITGSKLNNVLFVGQTVLHRNEKRP
jgi:hypothetical protein